MSHLRPESMARVHQAEGTGPSPAGDLLQKHPESTDVPAGTWEGGRGSWKRAGLASGQCMPSLKVGTQLFRPGPSSSLAGGPLVV